MIPGDDRHDQDDRRVEPAMEIEPISFRLGPRRFPFSLYARWLGWTLVLLCLLTFSGLAWWALTAKQIVMQVQPTPDRLSVSGAMVVPKIGSYYFLQPGTYTIQASKVCYQRLEQTITVTDESRQIVRLALTELPGRLTLRAFQAGQPALSIDAHVHIDDTEMGTTPLHKIAVPSGQRRVQLRAEHYQGLQTDVQVEGCGIVQEVNVALIPNWADVTIVAMPEGARVQVDGKQVGTTPLTHDFLQGTYEVVVSAPNYKPWRTRLQVQANQSQVLDNIRLQPADGILALATKPSDAAVTVDGTFAGKTPLQIPLQPNTRHRIRISQPGYEKVTQNVTVASAKTRHLMVELQPRLGVVQLIVEPPDAELVVNGISQGTPQRELRLLAVAHELEIRKDGYDSFRTTITPTPDFPQELRVMLHAHASARKPPTDAIQAVNGYPLKLMPLGTFTMGASRREQGRRSNETLRQVTLKRPFYIGVREVTNTEFRTFLAQHNSGGFGQQSLNRDTQPVVQVTWDEAARFANWLSQKERLPPVYTTRGKQLVVTEPLQTGYRLCTEAEWEYSARFQKAQTLLKYPWGDRFPPVAETVNIADRSASGLLANYLESYNDGYPVTAPTSSFQANRLGLYDMGGNVAEWCHDYYSIYPVSARDLYVDPIGPKQGKFRVVRGSSWKHASISALRLSFRDYSNTKRPDLGFRLCRYLHAVPEKR